MTAGRLVREAAGSAAPGATAGTFAAALSGEPDAASAEEASDIVHGTVPRVREVWPSELLAWTGDDDRHRHLFGAAFLASRTRP